MELQYSQEHRGKVVAFTFEKWEKEMMAKAMLPEIRKREKKIERIQNDPKNEGQVKYQFQIEELEKEISSIREIINAFR